jgi:hypothetical protein
VPKCNDIIANLTAELKAGVQSLGSVVALLKIPLLLNEKLSSFVRNEFDATIMHPYIYYDSSAPLHTVTEFSVAADGITLCTVSDIISAFIILHATYFIFNISYCSEKGNSCIATQSFFSKSFYDMDFDAAVPNRIRSKVLSFITKLNRS